MKILFLGDITDKQKTETKLQELGCSVDHTMDRIQEEQCAEYDLILSFGYRHILKKKHLERCKRPPVNVHPSLLPFNGGTHANFWAWYDKTPHGVTIHHIDEGIDTGDIIVQKEIFFSDEEMPLDKSYWILRAEMEDLFVLHAEKILSYSYIPQKQRGLGTFHYSHQLPEFEGGWNQSIEEVRKQLGER